jgi:hypothetical protein
MKTLENILAHLTPENWCKKYVSKTAEGILCSVRDKNACRWCIYGHFILMFSPEDSYVEGLQFLNEAALTKNPKTTGLLDYNDREETTFSDIVDIVKLAITLAKAKENERSGMSKGTQEKP